MVNPFCWNSRKSVKALEAWCFWIGIVFFFICAISGFFNDSTLGNCISGAAFIVGLALEVVSRKCDTRCEILIQRETDDEDRKHREEINALQLKAGHATEIAVSLAIQQAPREITDAQRECFKTSLSKYSGQWYEIVQVGFGDDEAARFATKLNEVLDECGWKGRAAIFDKRPDIKIPCGIAVEYNPARWGNYGSEKASLAFEEIRNTIAKAGFVLFYCSSPHFRNTDNGMNTINIVIGPKPTAAQDASKSIWQRP